MDGSRTTIRHRLPLRLSCSSNAGITQGAEGSQRDTLMGIELSIGREWELDGKLDPLARLPSIGFCIKTLDASVSVAWFLLSQHS